MLKELNEKNKPLPLPKKEIDGLKIIKTTQSKIIVAKKSDTKKIKEHIKEKVLKNNEKNLQFDKDIYKLKNRLYNYELKDIQTIRKFNLNQNFIMADYKKWESKKFPWDDKVIDNLNNKFGILSFRKY